jgi:hypothetical protein
MLGIFPGGADVRTVSTNDRLAARSLAVNNVIAGLSKHQNFNAQSGKIECFCSIFPHQMTVTFHAEDVEGRDHVFVECCLYQSDRSSEVQ